MTLTSLATRIHTSSWLSGTYIEAEEYAYNTYTGGHSRSNRRGWVRYPDGLYRLVTLGVADSFFSIPAHGRLKGKYVSGFVSVDTDAGWDGQGEYVFTITSGKEQRGATS